MFCTIVIGQSCDIFKSNDPKPKTELEKLPPPTQTGKNTFGCLVNGKAWVPKTSVDAGAVFQQGSLQIFGIKYSPTQSIEISGTEQGDLLNAGVYSLTNYPASYSKILFDNNIQYCIYEPESIISGYLKISKLDRISYIISGEFEIVAELNGCDKLTITNGRFDLKYIP